MAVGQKTKEIVALFDSGLGINEIADKYDITPRSVEKRLRSFKRAKEGYARTAPPPTWDIETIQRGFDRFVGINGRLPTADEVDLAEYLPSSRQIQRRFGGLKELRNKLGYVDTDFSKGNHRSLIQKSSRLRGSEAEIQLYEWLVERFGEPFVHSEKEYGDVRNRADFLIYAKGITIGVDVFATNTIKTLRKNVDIKAKKYTKFPTNVPLYFVAWGAEFAQEDIDKACRTHLSSLSNLKVITANVAFEYFLKVQPLEVPVDFKPMIINNNSPNVDK